MRAYVAALLFALVHAEDMRSSEEDGQYKTVEEQLDNAPEADSCMFTDLKIYNDAGCTGILQTLEPKNIAEINLDIKPNTCKTEKDHGERLYCISSDTFVRTRFKKDTNCDDPDYDHPESFTLQSGVCTLVGDKSWAVADIVPNYNAEYWQYDALNERGLQPTLTDQVFSGQFKTKEEELDNSPMADSCMITDLKVFKDDKCTEYREELDYRWSQEVIFTHLTPRLMSNKCEQSEDGRKERWYCLGNDTTVVSVYNNDDPNCEGPIYQTISYKTGVCTKNKDGTSWSIVDIAPNYNSQSWQAAIAEYRSSNEDSFDSNGRFKDDMDKSGSMYYSEDDWETSGSMHFSAIAITLTSAVMIALQSAI